MREDTPLWAGRFSSPPAPEAHALGRSLQFDVRLASVDVDATRTWMGDTVRAYRTRRDVLPMHRGGSKRSYKTIDATAHTKSQRRGDAAIDPLSIQGSTRQVRHAPGQTPSARRTATSCPTW